MKLTWTPPPIKGPTRCTFIWGNNTTVKYAPKVHEGLDGRGYKSRRWTDAAIDETDVPQLFADHFEGDISDAFMSTAEALGDRFQFMIEDWRWSWPNMTFRENGDVVETPRDIVDTGALRDSQRIEFHDRQ